MDGSFHAEPEVTHKATPICGLMHGGYLVQLKHRLHTLISAAPEDLDLVSNLHFPFLRPDCRSLCPVLVVEPACEQNHPPLSGRCGNEVQRHFL